MRAYPKREERNKDLAFRGWNGGMKASQVDADKDTSLTQRYSGPPMARPGRYWHLAKKSFTLSRLRFMMIPSGVLMTFRFHMKTRRLLMPISQVVVSARSGAVTCRHILCYLDTAFVVHRFVRRFSHCQIH